MLKSRCFGNGPGKEFYAEYHDAEWGVPVHDDQLLFEMLILEGAQAGLSWETVLKRRDGYRTAFHQFDVQKVAHMDDAELELLCSNPALIRHRGKIYSVRDNALVFLKIQKEHGSFRAYLWSYVNNTPIINSYASLRDIPTSSPISNALSKDLKKRGMKFVGSTIMYAYMQAIGMVNDHIASCWLSPKSSLIK